MSGSRYAAGPVSATQRIVGLVLDLASWSLAGLCVVVVLTGGGTLQVGRATIGVRSVGNALLGLAVLLLLRSRIAGVAVLGARGASLVDLGLRWRNRLSRLRTWFEHVDARTAKLVVVAAITAATTIRVANSVFFFGFITGDDVEIQEMSLARVLHRDWPAWDLRNAFYPMVFIYPAQRLLHGLGVEDVFALVLCGRLVVTGIAGLNIWLSFVVADRVLRHRGQALVAALIFSFSHLHMRFGSAELPRVVATAFVLTAFAALLRATIARTVFGGVLLGVGASLRFGEIVFLAPAAVTVLRWGAPQEPWSRRLLRVGVLIVVAIGTSLAIIAVSDAWFWGEAFHSLRAIIDYTLVRRLSSRGYEPFWHYATGAAEWSNVVLVALAMRETRKEGRVISWALLPMVLLSLLPHKEARYVMATIPFWCIAAAKGLWRSVDTLSGWPDSRRSAMAALALAAAVLGACVYDASRFRFRRSEEDVRLGWAIMQAGTGGLAADQLWRFGGRLYLDRMAPLEDLDPALASDEGAARVALCRPKVQWAVLLADRLTGERQRVLAKCGYAPADPMLPARSVRYRVFRRSADNARTLPLPDAAHPSTRSGCPDPSTGSGSR